MLFPKGKTYVDIISNKQIQNTKQSIIEAKQFEHFKEK